MKKFIAILFLFLVAINLSASDSDSLRYDLLRLLNERKIMFEEYSTSLEKKSGIFGNRTKGNLKDSHEALRKIVDADNKIIGVLNRTLQFKNFEKKNLSYDASNFEERINALKTLNDTLTKQNEKYYQTNKTLNSKVKRHNIYFILFVLGIVGFVWWRRKKINK